MVDPATHSAETSDRAHTSGAPPDPTRLDAGPRSRRHGTGTGTDDATLIAAAVAGDRTAMDTLLRAHYDRIFTVCRRITGSDADAADAAQEALIAVVRSLAGFDGRSSFGTWVYRIATNASLDELRRRRRRPVLADATELPEDHDAHLADPESGHRIATIDDRLELDTALRQVAEEFRVPLVLRDVGDLDYAEIATILDIPIGTVKSRIARGRAALGRILGGGNRSAPHERPTTDT